MGYRTLGIILLILGISWMIIGIFVNGWLFLLGFLVLIASTYFLSAKTKKKSS